MNWIGSHYFFFVLGLSSDSQALWSVSPLFRSIASPFVSGSAQTLRQSISVDFSFEYKFWQKMLFLCSRSELCEERKVVDDFA